MSLAGFAAQSGAIAGLAGLVALLWFGGLQGVCIAHVTGEALVVSLGGDGASAAKTGLGLTREIDDVLSFHEASGLRAEVGFVTRIASTSPLRSIGSRVSPLNQSSR